MLCGFRLCTEGNAISYHIILYHHCNMCQLVAKSSITEVLTFALLFHSAEGKMARCKMSFHQTT